MYNNNNPKRYVLVGIKIYREGFDIMVAGTPHASNPTVTNRSWCINRLRMNATVISCHIYMFIFKYIYIYIYICIYFWKLSFVSRDTPSRDRQWNTFIYCYLFRRRDVWRHYESVVASVRVLTLTKEVVMSPTQRSSCMVTFTHPPPHISLSASHPFFLAGLL